MLALSRKKNESIVINNDIEVTVLEIKGDQVKMESQPLSPFRCTARRYMRRLRMRTGLQAFPTERRHSGTF